MFRPYLNSVALSVRNPVSRGLVKPGHLSVCVRLSAVTNEQFSEPEQDNLAL
jgi:hypothetical protein